MEPETQPALPPRALTNWPGVICAVLGGIAAAMQIGKASASLPPIRDEFSASLTFLSVYAALVSLVGALGGIAFGTLARQVGPRPVGLAGLCLAATGSALGALSPGTSVLLATRFLEAMGFALTVTTMPALIQSETAPKDRGLALGLWAAWMPSGVAAMMAIGYFGLETIGWRGIFWICAAAPAIAAGLIALITRPGTRLKPGGATPSLQVLRDRNTRLTAGIFTGFSASYLAIVAFLPTVFVDTLGFAPSLAALIGFACALALIPTSIFSGWLTGRGTSPTTLFTISLTGMCVTAIILLTPGFGTAAGVSAAIAYGLFAGVPPAVIWASIPLLARRPEDAPLLSGTFFQAAGIGQVAGPILTGLVVDITGHWTSALAVIGGVLAICVILAQGLRKS